MTDNERRLRDYAWFGPARSRRPFSASASQARTNHFRATGLVEGRWAEATLNFTSDARRNDGTTSGFAAGHFVDDLFFFMEPRGDEPLELFIDEVVTL